MRFLTFSVIFFLRPSDMSFSAFNISCGMDKSPATIVYEGIAEIEMYPWLGLLVYPMEESIKTSTVVLIAPNIVLAAALDVDQYPKVDFRAKARVVLGQNCSGHSIGIRDYAYHPDYNKHSYSALAMVQLKNVLSLRDLHPICPPPADFKDANIYAMSVTPDCDNLTMRIYKMEYVSHDKCKQFYRRTDLDVESMWPTHFACARGIYGGNCVWKNGAALVMRHKKKWRLLGFGIYGPGCEAPARFMDYGMYHQWVRNSVAMIGRPAITRMGPDHIILRRTVSNVQRYGPCDPEELKDEIYIDETVIVPPWDHQLKIARYNLSLLATMDYSCMILRVTDEAGTARTTQKPRIVLRRLCTSPKIICYEFNLLNIDFYTEITFTEKTTYKISAYGKEIRIMDVKTMLGYLNKKKPLAPIELVRYNLLYRYWKDGFYND